MSGSHQTDLMPDPVFLAVDWGTTNRRVYVIDSTGNIIATERDSRGVTSLSGEAYEAEVADMRDRFGDLPMLFAGMVGSTRGWLEVPYLSCPADLSAIAGSLRWIDRRTAIVPGLSIRESARCDVMRGEEVQILGAVVAGLVPRDALVCQPGTHCKWARLAAGRIATFRTTMTGELFALLRQHSLLADFLNAEVVDGDPFRAGIAESRNPRLLTTLFGVRASMLLDQHPHEYAASFVSGLLIGSDVREQAIIKHEKVYVLADQGIGELYGSALSVLGFSPVIISSESAFAAGMNEIWRFAHAPGR